MICKDLYVLFGSRFNTTALEHGLSARYEYRHHVCTRALLIRGYGQNVPPCTSALGQWTVFDAGGSRTCGFKAALPRQRLGFCAILSNVAVRS